MADKRSVGRKSRVAEIVETEPEQWLQEGLPVPEVLAKYEKIVPGGAARLLDLSEKRAVREQRLEHSLKVTRMLLGAATGILGGVLLLNGSELAGLIVVLAAVGIVILSRDGGKITL